MPENSLLPGTKYYYRFVVYGMETAYTGRQLSSRSFTTLEEGEFPEEEEPAVPGITDWDKLVGDALGTSETTGGIFITMLFMCMILFPTLFFTQNSGNQMNIVLAMGIIGLSVTTAFTWTPIWVVFVIAIIFFYALARGHIFRGG
jgi:hypothetical protein